VARRGAHRRRAAIIGGIKMASWRDVGMVSAGKLNGVKMAKSAHRRLVTNIIGVMFHRGGMRQNK
jgi:hypothetical protein